MHVVSTLDSNHLLFNREKQIRMDVFTAINQYTRKEVYQLKVSFAKYTIN